jgi:hypothetical protein
MSQEEKSFYIAEDHVHICTRTNNLAHGQLNTEQYQPFRKTLLTPGLGVVSGRGAGLEQLTI